MTTQSGVTAMKAHDDFELTTIAQEFVETNLVQIDNVFKDLEGTSMSRRASIMVNETDGMKKAKKDFMETVSRFNHVMRKEKRSEVIVDIENHDFSWDDVTAAIEMSRDDYVNIKDRSLVGKLRHAVRECANFHAPVTSWLRLLPSDSWQGSLICGGLKIIIGAAARLGEIREEIFGAIEKIPAVIARAETFMREYPDGPVEAVAGSLITTTLELMQECVLWFMRNPMKKYFGALLKDKNYASDLQTKLKNLESVEAQMDRRADAALHQRQGFTFRQVMNIDGTTKRSEAVLQRILTFMSDQERLRERERELAVQLGHLTLREEQILQKNLALTQTYKRLLISTMDSYSPTQALEDMSTGLAIGRSLNSRLQSRAKWILSSEPMSRWLDDSKSSTLVVNAREPSTHGENSITSFLSAMLIDSLGSHSFDASIHPPSSSSQANLTASSARGGIEWDAGASDITSDDEPRDDIRARGGASVIPDGNARVILSYFCAPHRTGSLSDLLTSLICQLLDQDRGTTEPGILPSEPDRIDWTFETLLGLFERVLKSQLKRGEVFCILDSVSFYEDRKRIDELTDLWGVLNGFIERCEGGKGDKGKKKDKSKGSRGQKVTGELWPLKVLVTAPKQCTHIGTKWDETGPVDVLWVPESIPGR